MKARNKTILITLIFTVITFAIGPMLWPMNAAWPAPSSTQLPFLIGVAILESIGFGLGIAFLLQGWPLVKKVAHGSKFTAWSLYIGIAWYLISWWPHDSMHRMINHDDYWSLIGIEYGFHITLMLAGALIGYGFFDVMKWYESHSSIKKA